MDLERTQGQGWNHANTSWVSKVAGIVPSLGEAEHVGADKIFTTGEEQASFVSCVSRPSRAIGMASLYWVAP